MEIAGVPALPSALSLTGAALAIDGARRLDSPLGLLEVAAGRSLDLADGAVARALDQTSEAGAAIDAVADKAAGLALLVGEWRRDIAPRTALAAIAIQNAANGVATYVAQRRHPEAELRPSRDGKHAMFAQNIALGAYAAGNLLQQSRPRPARLLRGLGHLATVVGVGYYGSRATAGYVRRAASVQNG